jgi:ATP-dependent DNA ligase
MLTFVAFGILRLNGRSLLDYEHAGRRRLLERLVRLSDGALTSVATFDGEISTMCWSAVSSSRWRASW